VGKVAYGCEAGGQAAVDAGFAFIEVKGRVEGAPSVTVTRNEIMRALNVPDEFMLAIVGIAQGQARNIHYVRSPFTRMPDFAEISVNYDMNKLITRAEIGIEL